MCGFAGEIAIGTGGRTDLERSQTMLRPILHRGPDGRGAWQEPDGRIAMSHCRLAIVDIEHGHQPMHGSDGHVTIAYNGQLYGFEAHRRDLEDGYRFRNRSDTEVLIALYLRHGPDFVAMLEGEFAFVLYDARIGRTLMARDRFGIKPLFLSRHKDLLLFGSEIKAILAHPLVKRAINPAALHRRMHGVMIPEETVFDGVEALPPGTMMLVERSGETRVHRHADLDPAAAGTLHLDREAACEAFEAAFSAAVRDRLQGDVPVGVYLSGGVDSTATAAFMREASNAPLKAFTIGFQDRAFGEGDHAAATATDLGLEHHVESIGTGDLDAHFARSVWHGETTVMNSHGTAKMCLSGRTARNGVKVVLAGEGVDEIHGGYSWQRHAGLIEGLRTRQDKRALKAFLAEHGPADGVLSRATPKLRAKLAGHENKGVPYAAMRASFLSGVLGCLFSPEFKARTEPEPARQLLDWLEARSPGARKLDDATLSRLVAAITDLPTYNFSYLGDRAEMANAVEGRLPYLDKRVADLLWQLPAEFHIDATSNKTMVREALARRKTFTHDRFKRIFLAPSSTTRGVFEGPMADRWLSRQAVEEAGVFRPGRIAAIRFTHRALPRGSGLKRLLETFLMLAISAHLLDSLFCKDFSGSVERFAVEPARMPAAA